MKHLSTPNIAELRSLWPVAVLLLSMLLSIANPLYGTMCVGAGFAVAASVRIPSLMQLPRLTISSVDIIIAICILVEIVAFTQSTLALNSSPYLMLVLHAVLAYYFIRMTVTRERQITFLSWGVAGIAAYWCAMTMKKALWISHEITLYGFSDLAEFRNAYSPLVASNEWTLYLLLTLPFPLILFLTSRSRLTTVVSAVVTIAILLCVAMGFSRGGYLAVMLIGVILTGGLALLHRKKLTRFVAGSFLALAVVAVGTYSHWGTVTTTIKMNESMSQQRSTDSRTRMWDAAVSALGERPLFGVGAYNFAHAYNVHHKRTFDEAPLGRVTSLATQITAEKGLVGIMLTFVLALLVIIGSWRYFVRPRSDTEISSLTLLTLLACLGGVVVRELSISTLLFRGFIFQLFCLVVSLVLVLCHDRWKAFRVQKAIGLVLSLPVLVVGSLAIYAHFCKANVEGLCVGYVEAMHAGDMDLAKKSAVQLEAVLPHHPVPKLYLASSDSVCEDVSPYPWDAILQCPSEESQIALLKQAVALEPRDETLRFALGLQYARMAEWQFAMEHISAAVATDPTISEYALMLGMVAEKAGDTLNVESAYADALAAAPGLFLSQWHADLVGRNPGLASRMLSGAISKVAVYDDPVSKARYGALLLFDGQPLPARAALESASRQLPGMNRPYFYLGEMALSDGDSSTCRALWQKSWYLDRFDRMVNAKYGALLAPSNPDRARKMLRRSISPAAPEPIALKRRILYPSTKIYRNTTLSASFMRYISPTIDTDAVQKLLQTLSPADRQ